MKLKKTDGHSGVTEASRGESQTRILTELPKPSFFFFPKQTSYRRLDSLLLGGLVKGVLAAVGTAEPKAVRLQGGSQTTAIHKGGQVLILMQHPQGTYTRLASFIKV